MDGPTLRVLSSGRWWKPPGRPRPIASPSPLTWSPASEMVVASLPSVYQPLSPTSGSSVPPLPPPIPSVTRDRPAQVKKRGHQQGSSLERYSPRVAHGSESVPCLWWIAEKCRAQLKGVEVRCTNVNHGDRDHPRLRQIRLQAALDALSSQGWASATKEAFSLAFTRNKNAFA
jgi:hypothetical protein